MLNCVCVKSKEVKMISKPKRRPLVATIFSEAGMGKTSLAATFPKPIFMRLEDGMQSIEGEMPDTFEDMPKSYQTVLDQLSWLKDNKHEYKTLVIDSITAMDQMLTDEIVSTENRKNPNVRSINQAGGGYGAGLSMLAGLHRNIRKVADDLNRENGMHVIFLAHAEIQRLNPPDGSEYTRYSIRMPEKCQAPYIDNVDIVAYIRQVVFLTGEGQSRKALGSGERVIVAYSTPVNVSKNRYGIEDDLPFEKGSNPIITYLKAKKND